MMTIREYKRVESLEEAWELNQKKANRVIGGMIWLKMSRGNVGTAIDISGLGLDQIEETEDAFEIGAMVTLRQSVRNTQTDFPVLTCAAAKRADGSYRFSIGARPGRAVLFEASAETIQALIEEKQKAETKADADADTRENQDKTQTGKKAACLAKWIRDQVRTSSNMRGSAEYRKHLTGVLIKRAVRMLEEC